MASPASGSRGLGAARDVLAFATMRSAETVIAAFKREQRVNLLVMLLLVTGIFAGAGLALTVVTGG
jgi:hypothetical protein